MKSVKQVLEIVALVFAILFAGGSRPVEAAPGAEQGGSRGAGNGSASGDGTVKRDVVIPCKG